MPKGQIISVGFTGIATKGRLSLGGNWTTTATGNYAISNMNLTLTGAENQDIISGTKTLLMIPQSFTTDNQKIAITYAFDGNTYNLTGSLKGTSWGKGQSVVYKVSPHSVSRLQLGTITFDSSWGSNYPKTSFAANDAVGIYVADASGLKYSNVKLTLGSDGKWTSASRVLLPENCKYYVYYPYSTSGLANTRKAANDAATFFASGIASWSPKADQSSSTNLYASDLQVAAGTISTTNASTVNFSMSHQMGLAVITLKSGTVTSHYLSNDKSYTFTNTQTMKASSSFTGQIPILHSTDKYVKVIKPKTSTTFGTSDNVLGKWSAAVTASGAGAVASLNAIPSATQPYFLKPGDVYYSDGAITHNEESLASGKTPIGIVGYVGSNYWTEKDTKAKGIGGHALVMCLKTIGSTGTTNHGSIYQWKTADTDDSQSKVNTSSLIVGSSDKTYGSGYTESKALNNADHPAAYAALHYTTLSAPNKATGWFLPTAGQYYAIMNAIGGYPSSGWDIMDFVGNNKAVSSKVNTALSRVGTNNYTEFFQANNTWEWTSTEYSTTEAIYVDSGIDDGAGDGSIRFVYLNGLKWSGAPRPVRPFLAF